MAKVIPFSTATPTERAVREVVNLLSRPPDGVFVGREREMDELRASLEDAFLGRGRLVLLAHSTLRGCNKGKKEERQCDNMST